MDKIKIYIYYNITDKPWGGGNSFLKAFRNYVNEYKSDEFEFAQNINDNHDIFFMNGGHKDQGIYVNIREIKKVRQKGIFKKRRSKTKIIYRVDGARYKYIKKKSVMDKLQYRALNLTDHIIFQSKECLESFQILGYKKNNYSIIHNGVDQKLFNTKNKIYWDGKSQIRMMSCSWSSNAYKGFKTISAFSKHPDIHSVYVGRWNDDFDSSEIDIHLPVPQEELSKYYKESHIFLHPSENDSCPNVVLEAMSCGLPVIYHNSGGTKDITHRYGIVLPNKISDDSISSVINDIKKKYFNLNQILKENHDSFSINKVAEKYLNVFRKVLR